MNLELRPIFRDDARRFVGEHHRHCDPPQGWLFGVSVVDGEQVVGVGMAGRPVARHLQDGRTIEITRVCVPSVEAKRNVCSQIYGALCRAAAALGYNRAVTYTLVSETATSVRAAGFVVDGESPARPRWNYVGQVRHQSDMFGHDRRPTEAKVRWVRWLS